MRSGARPPIRVLTRSGETLVVDFRLEGGTASAVKLTGDARLLYEGTLDAAEWEVKEEAS